MNPFKITIIFILLSNFAFGQYKPFVPDSAFDNEWVKQLFNSEHLEISNSDSNEYEWIYGKVFYSPDNYIRIAQIAAIHKKTDILVIESTLQYNLDGKLIEKKLGIENETQQIPIRQIHKLTGTKPTYLIMGSMGNFHDKYDSLGKPLAIYNTSNSEVDDVYGLKEITYGAYLLTLNKDSVFQIDFVENEDYLSYRFSLLLGGLEINSMPKISEKCPEPFLKYDSLKKELSYQLIYDSENDCLSNEDCNYGILGINTGVFSYQDSVFVLVENKQEYFPPLESTADTIIKKYKIGYYQFKATAIKKYAEVGEGILQILEVNYTVNGQKMEFINQVDFEFNNKMNLKPDCKIQSDSSLIILLTSNTTRNMPGM